MTAIERLFRLEIEFCRRTRLTHVEPGIHTSWALQMGYERLIRESSPATEQELNRLLNRLLLAGDTRDVLGERFGGEAAGNPFLLRAPNSAAR